MFFSSCCQHLVQGEHVKAVYGLPRNIFIVTNPRKAAFRFVIAIECHKQSWAHDNTAATTWPCFQATKMLVIALLFYSFWLLHLDTAIKKISNFVLSPKLYYIVALSLSRLVLVAKLNHCHVPSSGIIRYPGPLVPGEQVQVVRLRGDQLLQLLKQGEERPQQHAQVHLNETYKTSWNKKLIKYMGNPCSKGNVALLCAKVCQCTVYTVQYVKWYKFLRPYLQTAFLYILFILWQLGVQK